AEAPAPIPAQNLVSRGMTRGRIKNQNLLLVSGAAPQVAGPVTAIHPHTVTALKTSTAYKPEIESSPTALNPAELEPIPSPPPSKDTGALAAVAQMKGYTGDQCTECHNFTMVRNGTCLKCDTGGTTTGCS